MIGSYTDLDVSDKFCYSIKNDMIWLHFISILILDVLLIISNFSTTCQLTLIRVLVYYSRLSVDC